MEALDTAKQNHEKAKNIAKGLAGLTLSEALEILDTAKIEVRILAVIPDNK